DEDPRLGREVVLLRAALRLPRQDGRARHGEGAPALEGGQRPHRRDPRLDRHGAALTAAPGGAPALARVGGARRGRDGGRGRYGPVTLKPFTTASSAPPGPSVPSEPTIS